ncbi:MAG: hypothetical protein ACM3RX_04045 [Methanococcaceae archaeon]
MKLIIILLAGLLIITLTCHAQNKSDKVRSYTYSPDDPYKPKNAVIASSFLPGLGQMICNEGLKGIGFLTGYAGGLILTFSGIKMALQTTLPEPNWDKVMPIARARIKFGLVTAATFWLWSRFDAPRTAKIQNMKFREKNMMSGEMFFQHYIGDPSVSANNKISVGLSINIKF